MKSHNAQYSGRKVSKNQPMWMNIGQSSSVNLLPISRFATAPCMLEKQHDEQNVIAGSDIEFVDPWSCRQIARDA